MENGERWCEEERMIKGRGENGCKFKMERM